jgi:hypothetical protein
MRWLPEGWSGGGCRQDGAALAGGIVRERIGEEDGVDRGFGRKNMKDVSAKLPVWRLIMDGGSITK